MNYESSALERSEDHGFRSSFVRGLVQCHVDSRPNRRCASLSVPKTIIQFWDDPFEMPDDVGACMRTWHYLTRAGYA
ncbi:MAG TPA: hypothetical protein VGL15_04190, partial [Vicinamibacteria bacterium]